MNNKRIYYNNIKGLLKADIVLEYTDFQIKEIIRCSTDIEYFLEKYVKIIHPDRGIVPFVLYDYQKELVELFKKNKRVIALFCRQSGKTITTSGYILHYIIFQKSKNIAILANKGATARKILTKIKNMYKSLPIWLQVGVEEWNKSSVDFGNGNVIEASNTSSDGIRGDSISLLFLDELAFVDQNLWSEFWKSTYPTLSASKEAQILISSTPNGLNHFWKLWADAINGKNGYSHLKVLWDGVPDRDEKWKIDTLKGMGGDEEKFASEFNCEFCGSGGTLISSYALKNMVFGDPEEIKFDDKFKIYTYPEKNHQYIIIFDPSEGLGLDYSTIQVLDISNDITEQVAVFRDNEISTQEFPFIIDQISQMYNDALIIGENNLFEEILNDLNYELDCNVFHDDKFGIRMTTKSKKNGCAFLKRNIENNLINIHDFNTISEFGTFIKNKNSFEADIGYHDDLITPLILYSFFIKNKEWVENWVDDYDVNVNIKDFQKKVHDDLLPAGYVNNGDEVIGFETM